MSDGGQRLWDPWKMYDAKPEELRAMKERSKMREALRAEWTKKYSNPFKSSQPGGFLVCKIQSSKIISKSRIMIYRILNPIMRCKMWNNNCGSERVQE